MHNASASDSLRSEAAVSYWMHAGQPFLRYYNSTAVFCRMTAGVSCHFLRVASFFVSFEVNTTSA